MLKPLIITGLAFAFIGCASTTTSNKETSQEVAKSEKDSKYICQKTHQVGSHFKKLQCWTKEEYAAKQQRDKEEIERAQRSSMGPFK